MESVIIEGYYRKTIYQSVQYGPSIVLYDIDGEELTLTGIMLPVIRNIKYRFSGMYVMHQKYGKQFRVESYEELIENNEKGIIEYLSSGLIKGLGRKTAEKIVSRFGLRTIEIMEQDIQRLTEIKGITTARLAKIEASFIENRATRDITLKLSKYGISPKLSAKAYAKFGSDTMDIIENEPYKLSFVPGITFPQADQIGKNKDNYETNYDRFKCCAAYVLYQNESNGMKNIIGNRTNGSLGMDKDDFGKCMLALLRMKNINGSFICENTIKMIQEGELVYRTVDNSNLLFLPGMYRIENSIADNIYRLCNGSARIADIDAKINEAQKALGIILGEKQYEAVKNTFTNGLSLIVGPPGSGKTTTLKTISYIYKKYCNNNIQFLAPTGIAAARIRETSGEFATTIHSALSIGTEMTNDVEETDIIFEDCLLGIDEFSMADARLSYKLFSCIGSNSIVVICGDPDQLPSVGAGAVLRDLLESNVVPATILDTVYRTASGSNIYLNANKIRKGDTGLIYDDDFKFFEIDNTKELENTMIEYYLRKVNEFGLENVKLMAPFKEHDAGVNNLNTNIQEILNPSAVDDRIFKYSSGYYRIGDVVMHLKNDSEQNIVNGDIGIVTDIANIDGEITLFVAYEGNNVVQYTLDNIEDITLAYAFTVHKAQGSEAACVITTIHSMHSIMCKRNIIYTAITRGKKEVAIFGQRSALSKAILTEDRSKRYTALKMLLRLKFGEFTSVSFIA